MTTFQAIIYGLIHGFSEFLPIGRSAHEMIATYLFNWPAPQTILSGAFSLGALWSLLVYFRHDWASMISCFLQVCLFRKRPMTLDERLPIFLTITSIPLAAATFYLQPLILGLDWNPGKISLALALFSIPIWMGDSTSRKNKGMFDWNWLDALWVGIAQSFAIVPGCGLITGILSGALLRNYNLEAAAKYSLFAITPVIATHAIIQLRGFSIHALTAAEGVSWLTFNVSMIVTFFAGLLAIGGFMRQVQKKSLRPYIFYRWFFAVLVIVLYWIRTKK